jgi:oxygen-independent coproporphyrinogen-3 oxidase
MMYEHTRSRLSELGFRHYEISNWAHPGSECRHNLVYWRSGNWLAFGPSASGHVDGMRWKNVPRLGDWLSGVSDTPVVDLEQVETSRRVGEFLMLEFRLLEGLSRARLDELLRASDPGGRRHEAIMRALEEGILVDRDDRVRLSDRGMLLADSLLSELI